MSTKNVIFLGLITDFILHFHRNFFNKKDIKMSKRVQKKIKQKHPNVELYTNRQKFLILLNNTIASVGYDNNSNTINFISYLENEDKFILYSLKAEKHHIVCNTIFSLKANTLRSYYKKKDFRLFKNMYKSIIEEFIQS